MFLSVDVCTNSTSHFNCHWTVGWSKRLIWFSKLYLVCLGLFNEVALYNIDEGFCLGLAGADSCGEAEGS